MNSNNNNLKQQPLAEPAFVDGTAVLKQIPSENFPTHNYDQTIRPDPYHAQPSVQPIPVGQAGGVPFGQENRSEHLHLNPSEPVTLPPNAEHVHITATAGQGSGNVEQVIRIKPDGKVLVTAEKVGEHHTETVKKEHVLPKQEHHVQPLRREHEVTPIVGLEKEHVKTKKVSEKKKHVEKVKDVVPTETTTVVTISEHEPGTLGYDREGKHGRHDDTHHHGKDHNDTHHHGKDHNDTHHHGIHGKDHADTHHHGTDETKVKVYKEHHGGKSGKKKHLKGGKHHHGTDATKVGKHLE